MARRIELKVTGQGQDVAGLTSIRSRTDSFLAV